MESIVVHKSVNNTEEQEGKSGNKYFEECTLN